MSGRLPRRWHMATNAKGASRKKANGSVAEEKDSGNRGEKNQGYKSDGE